ncbi:MAG: hypothetical protein SFX18_16355 [Pirellulales bacterium]|nr:hypothetical protein [Pirellulales bacterium]
MQTHSHVYTLNRPAAHGDLGLGILLILVPPGLLVYFWLAARQRDELAMVFVSLVALAFMGGGVYFIYRGIRVLRDPGPKLELHAGGLIDYRGRNIFNWEQILGYGYNIKYENNAVKQAELILNVADDQGPRQVRVDIRGLSQPPDKIIEQVIQFVGLR